MAMSLPSSTAMPARKQQGFDKGLLSRRANAPRTPHPQVDGHEPAIQHCNASSLALQGCVFTQDINRAIEISDAMETGTVQTGITMLDAVEAGTVQVREVERSARGMLDVAILWGVLECEADPASARGTSIVTDPVLRV
eukprot:1158216-Pelagomonas_calceolata.AAC.9